MHLKKGFTLIELIVVMGIITIFSGLVLTSLNLTNGHSQLKTSFQNTKNFIQRAKIEASLRQNNERRGIYIDTSNNDIILYSGTSYATRVTNSETVNSLAPGVHISSVLIAGSGDDINFLQRTGETSNTGSFTIYNDSGSYQFQINSNGSIEATYFSP